MVSTTLRTWCETSKGWWELCLFIVGEVVKVRVRPPNFKLGEICCSQQSEAEPS